ncbi:hypothetical protein [Jeotgalibaca sp. A127]|uniref:hypothetical protein n=1 Tax=Jeotgalibaca sp. A127 TaxID=3457324 RepID=UPI003FD4F84B
MPVKDNEVFAYLKPSLDAHTLGVNAAAELLRSCGYEVITGDTQISSILNDIRYQSNQEKLVAWLRENKITHVGLSYRLDEGVAVNMVGYVLYALRANNMLATQGGPINGISFAGLPKACKMIKEQFNDVILTFQGSESPQETLGKYGVPEERIPAEMKEGSKYDETLLKFGEAIIRKKAYLDMKPIARASYQDKGTMKDTLVKRLNATMTDNYAPLLRAHVGPFSSTATREENVEEFLNWCKHLSDTGYLDIVSIGSSQLSQSNFGEDWGDRPNGGGVPVNKPEEFEQIAAAASPMLVRTYSGTQRIPEMAKVYEDHLNTAWHALSLWWFNKMDGRGPYDVYKNLVEHVKTMKYIATTDKPFEPNTPHHFAFRGADDTTYVLSAYLAAKLAKKVGIKTFVLQIMLNTPRYTWGVQDLAKARAALNLVRNLEDENFRVILQPRAGLDYFSPDLDQARIQLAAVSALIDDIEPQNDQSPPVLHVVSYSEADHLATPTVINESVQITQTAIQEYRRQRRCGLVPDMSKNEDVLARTETLLKRVGTMVDAIEEHVTDPYSPEGFYTIFAAGFMPTPYIWAEKDEFEYVTKWRTKPYHGGVWVVDEEGKPVSAERVASEAIRHIPEIQYRLKQRNAGLII